MGKTFLYSPVVVSGPCCLSSGNGLSGIAEATNMVTLTLFDPATKLIYYGPIGAVVTGSAESRSIRKFLLGTLTRPRPQHVVRGPYLPDRGGNHSCASFFPMSHGKVHEINKGSRRNPSSRDQEPVSIPFSLRIVGDIHSFCRDVSMAE